uniref:Cytochrome P450 n=1 Tax=Biomphalaria glabrata TaxID=6526 RepID=A0A2C9JYP8_BIOGL
MTRIYRLPLVHAPITNLSTEADETTFLQSKSRSVILHSIAMLTLVLVGGTVVLCAVAFVRYMTANHGVLRKMGIEHPATSWFLGNFDQAFKYGVFEMQRVFYNKYKDKKVYGWYDARRPAIVVRDLDIVKDICVKNFNSFIDRHTLFDAEPPLRDNLLNLRGEHWRRVRNTLSPTLTCISDLTFLLSHINQLVNNFREVLHRLLRHDRQAEFREERSDLREKQNQGEQERVRVQHFLGFNGEFVLGIFEGVNLQAKPSAGDDVQGEAGTDLSQLNIFAAFYKCTFSSSLQGQAIVFILAGYDTVATVLSFTLFFLAMHPECCQKAQAEVDAKCGKEFPDYDKVQTLTYLDMCINEAIRLVPPGIFLNRKCVQDTDIQGVHFPKDMIVVIPVYAFHTDPDLFPEPEKFDPERFNPENKTTRHQYAHLPFGQGPRNCIGMRLALLELKIVMAAILQKLTPVPCSKTVYPIKLSKMQAKAQDGLWVKFQLRDAKT